MGVVKRDLFGAVVGTILIAAAAVESQSTAADESRDLTGQLLVAAPTMTDPTFSRSVIYMVAHDSDGALGVIVNEPVKDVTFSELFGLMQLGTRDLKGSVTVNFGGPVEPRLGFVLHSKDVMLGQHEVTAGDIAITTDPEMLATIAAGRGPQKFIVTLGYAGWGPGQLEREMQQGSWLVVPSDPDLVFAPDRRQIWQRAIASHETDL